MRPSLMVEASEPVSAVGACRPAPSNEMPPVPCETDWRNYELVTARISPRATSVGSLADIRGARDRRRASASGDRLRRADPGNFAGGASRARPHDRFPESAEIILDRQPGHA